MTDIIIPLGRGSKHDNIELRYALRSVHKYLAGYGRLILVGECPEWCRPDIHIEYEDSPGIRCKERNIYEKILVGCERSSAKFLYMNDDHFLLQPILIDKFPLHYKGHLKQSLQRTHSGYKYSLNNTVAVLVKNGHMQLCYDTHAPCLMDRDKFTEIMPGYNWKLPYGYVVKSLYFNTLKIVGEQYPDSKLYDDNIVSVKGRQYFSISDSAITDKMLLWFEQHYGDKSRWEM